MLNQAEPQHLADAVRVMRLGYVVITSVTRDDLDDGGATHFARCVAEIRKSTKEAKVEILVPDFRGRADVAIKNLDICLPDVFNHNLETVPRIYPVTRPGARYHESLQLV